MISLKILIDPKAYVFQVHWFEGKYVLCENFCEFCQLDYEVRLRALLQIKRYKSDKLEIIHIPISALNSIKSTFQDRDNDFYIVYQQDRFENKIFLSNRESGKFSFPKVNFISELSKLIITSHADVPARSVSIDSVIQKVSPKLFEYLEFPNHRVGGMWVIKAADLLKLDYNSLLSIKEYIPYDLRSNFNEIIGRERFNQEINLNDKLENFPFNKIRCQRRLSHLQFYSILGSNYFNLDGNINIYNILNKRDSNLLECKIKMKTITIKQLPFTAEKPTL